MLKSLLFGLLLIALHSPLSFAHENSSAMGSTTPTSAAAPVIEPIDLVAILPQTLRPYWEFVVMNPIIGSLMVALLFLIAAFAVRFFVIASIKRMSALSGGIIGDTVSNYLQRPVFTTVAYFGFALAAKGAQLGWFGEQLINLFLSVIVASWMRALFISCKPFLESIANNSLRCTFVDQKTIPLLDLVIKIMVILFGSYSLLMIWGVNPVGWLASAGIVGIAVGFAAKDTLANVFSGFFIIVDSPYKIGDYVNLDSGERGRVSHIGLRSTRLLSRDDIEITLPNAVIANAKILNESGGPAPTIRIAVAVGVAYDSDVDKVCRVLQELGENHAAACDNPAPRVRMRRFGPSSLDLELLIWILNPEDRGRIRHELLIAIHKAFRAEGIEIPYAKSDIYIKSLPQQDYD